MTPKRTDTVRAGAQGAQQAVSAATPPRRGPLQPPGRPETPGRPLPPGYTPMPPAPGRRNPTFQPTRVWLDPVGWPDKVYNRLLEHRIVMVAGNLDNEAATSLCAQLLTLDAEGTDPIRLELHNLEADLGAAATVMGVLDILRVPVSAYVGGRIRGPALGVLAAATHRYAYPNAVLVLSEPRMSFEGTTTAVASEEEQVRTMLAALFARLAETAGREIEEVRADAERERFLTVEQAIDYGLIERPAEPRKAS